MTEAEKIRVLVRYRLDQAAEALAAADLNLANGLRRSGGQSRLLRDVLCRPRTAGGASDRDLTAQRRIAQFDQLYVKPGLFRSEYSRWLHDAFLNRQSADYGAEVVLSHEEIETLLSHAREFVAAVRQHLEPA